MLPLHGLTIRTNKQRTRATVTYKGVGRASPFVVVTLGSLQIEVLFRDRYEGIRTIRYYFYQSTDEQKATQEVFSDATAFVLRQTGRMVDRDNGRLAESG